MVIISTQLSKVLFCNVFFFCNRRCKIQSALSRARYSPSPDDGGKTTHFCLKKIYIIVFNSKISALHSITDVDDK